LRGFVGLCRQLYAELHDAGHRLRDLLDLRECAPGRSFVRAGVGAECSPEAHDAEVAARGVRRDEAPIFETPFDLAAELEEVLAVDLHALDVRRFAARVGRVDDDEFRRTVAPRRKIAEATAKIVIAV